MTLTAIGSSLTAHQSVDATSVTSPTPEQKKAARDFEAIFLRQLMSSLEKSGGMGGESSGGEVFRSMMVGALADTAAEGGGIGLSELILKAMLPPPPQAKPDLSLHAPAAPAAAHEAASTGLNEPSATVPAGGSATVPAGGSATAPLGGNATSPLGDPAASSLGDPATSLQWGAPSRVLTEARRMPMLEVGKAGLAGGAREGDKR